ncbi:MAG TPA: small basic protein [bacterium]|nr:small basic protein [bacterium]
MSQHPSLRVDSVGARHRNVLKRLERIKKMREEGRWQEESSIYKLPKIKSMKIKVKKVKEAKEEGAPAGEAGIPSAAKPAEQAAKPQAGSKSAKTKG